MTATVTTIQPSGIAQAIDRRADAIMALADDCATANTSRCKAGQSIKLWDTEQTIISGLLPSLEPEAAQATLIECIEFVFRSRECDNGDLSDAEIAEHLNNGKDVAREAIIADTLAQRAA